MQRGLTVSQRPPQITEIWTSVLPQIISLCLSYCWSLKYGHLCCHWLVGMGKLRKVEVQIGNLWKIVWKNGKLQTKRWCEMCTKTA